MDRTSAIERYAAGYGDVLEALEDITEDELDRAPAGDALERADQIRRARRGEP